MIISADQITEKDIYIEQNIIEFMRRKFVFAKENPELLRHMDGVYLL